MVADSELAPEQLRQTSMLGSTTFLRVLAGVWYELVNEQKFDPDDVVELFALLAPHTGAPIEEDSVSCPIPGCPHEGRHNLSTARAGRPAQAALDVAAAVR